MLASVLVLAMGVASPNSSCPVTGFPVTNHLIYHYVTVKGRQYYVFDRNAANRLRNCPDCYLKDDGTPRLQEPPLQR